MYIQKLSPWAIILIMFVIGVAFFAASKLYEYYWTEKCTDYALSYMPEDIDYSVSGRVSLDYLEKEYDFRMKLCMGKTGIPR